MENPTLSFDAECVLIGDVEGGKTALVLEVPSESGPSRNMVVPIELPVAPGLAAFLYQWLTVTFKLRKPRGMVVNPAVAADCPDCAEFKRHADQVERDWTARLEKVQRAHDAWRDRATSLAVLSRELIGREGSMYTDALLDSLRALLDQPEPDAPTEVVATWSREALPEGASPEEIAESKGYRYRLFINGEELLRTDDEVVARDQFDSHKRMSRRLGHEQYGTKVVLFDGDEVKRSHEPLDHV